MSLEEALHANTAALNKLTELFSVVQIETVISEVTAQAAVAEDNTASNPPMPSRLPVSPSDEVAVPTAQAPVGEPEAADVIPYEKVSAAVTLAAAKKGREAVLEALAVFGLSSAKDSKAHQYADIIAACEALIASSEEA